MIQTDNYSWLNCIPQGWKSLARKMIQECEAVNSSYQIADVKEKFGELRIVSYIQDYNDNVWLLPACNDKEIEEIENKYIEQSRKTCCFCGAPATKISAGWISPWCDTCVKDIEGTTIPIEEFFSNS